MSVEPIYPQQPGDSVYLFQAILHLSKQVGIFKEEGYVRLNKVKEYFEKEYTAELTYRIFVKQVSLPINMNISREIGQGRGELPIALLILLKREYIDIPYDPAWHMDKSEIKLTATGRHQNALDELTKEWRIHDIRQKRINESMRLFPIAALKISANTVEEWLRLAVQYHEEGMIRQSELCKEKALEIILDYYQKLEVDVEGNQHLNQTDIETIAKDFVDNHYQDEQGRNWFP